MGTRETTPGTEAAPRRRRRYLRRAAVVLAALVCLYLFRWPLLRLAASALVVDQPAQATTALLLLNGDGGPDRAAACFHEGRAGRVLLIEEAPGRLTEMGILPKREDVLRRELMARQVPAEAVTLLAGRAGNDWDKARRLGSWLAGHRQASVTVLCDRFGSRRLRHVFTAVLGDGPAGRLRWWAPPDRRFDEANWWHGPDGFRAIFGAWTSLGYVWLCGEDREQWRRWDPDQYEKNLR